MDTQAANLVPIVFQSLGQGLSPRVFGIDFPTPDGSCVRDYVHVLDLAEAHLAAIDYLERDERPFDVFNVGTGIGSSVLEVIREVSSVSQTVIVPKIESRRAGDPASLAADVTRIQNVLGWRAKQNLHDIIKSVWEAQSL
jgi:UDP-glucose 4-epimerase